MCRSMFRAKRSAASYVAASRDQHNPGCRCSHVYRIAKTCEAGTPSCGCTKHDLHPSQRRLRIRLAMPTFEPKYLVKTSGRNGHVTLPASHAPSLGGTAACTSLAASSSSPCLWASIREFAKSIALTAALRSAADMSRHFALAVESDTPFFFASWFAH